MAGARPDTQVSLPLQIHYSVHHLNVLDGCMSCPNMRLLMSCLWPGVLARGDAAINMRFPKPGYREKIWDHAAGALIVQEAGAVISDASGALPTNQQDVSDREMCMCFNGCQEPALQGAECLLGRCGWKRAPRESTFSVQEAAVVINDGLCAQIISRIHFSPPGVRVFGVVGSSCSGSGDDSDNLPCRGAS